MLTQIIHLYRTAFSGLSKETWLLSLVMLINRTGTMVVPFMSIYVTYILGKSLANAGLIITAFGAGAVLGSLAGGYLADRIGFHKVQISASVCSGLLFIAFGMTDHFLILCILATAMGFTSEAFRPANFTAIASYSKPENLTKSYSLNRLAINIGFGLGSTIGGVLASINYHLLFWVEGLVYILVGILIFALLPARKHVEKVKVNVNADQVKSGQSPLKDVFFIKFLLWVTLYITSFYLVFRLVPVYWKEFRGITESKIGFILGLNGIIIALFEMILVQYLQKKDRKSLFIIIGILFTAVSFIFLLFPGLPALAAALLMVIFLTVGEMLSLPFINTIVVQRATAENRGRYASAYAFTWSVAQIIGPLGGAFLVEKTSYTGLWATIILLCTVSATGIYILFRRSSY
jgi:predicted MFS family arabinose efflux permease